MQQIHTLHFERGVAAGWVGVDDPSWQLVVVVGRGGEATAIPLCPELARCFIGRQPLVHRPGVRHGGALPYLADLDVVHVPAGLVAGAVRFQHHVARLVGHALAGAVEPVEVAFLEVVVAGAHLAP